MKNFILTFICTLIIITGLSENANSSMLDCEDLYDTCIDNNPFDKDDQFFAYYGYRTGCSSSRDICNEM